MADLFTKRMKLISPGGTVGEAVVNRTNDIVDKTFTHDQNFQRGMLYDWDLQPIEEVDFKFEKHKVFKAEGSEVEYHVHFRPNYNPEFLFKDRYFKNDGKERLGFYIDVYDNSKGKYEKWLIVGKDNRVAFDRYNAFRCNWMFEWIYKDEYHKCLGVLREAADKSFNSSDIDKLGGTSVSGEMGLIVPTCENTMTILLGQKFIISDNLLNPQTFEVDKIKDHAPFGVIRAYLKQRVFDPHTDYFGTINEETNLKFKFDIPIDDLPEEFGGQYHMICDCIEYKDDTSNVELEELTLDCDESVIYIGGRPVFIKAGGIFDGCKWHFFLDGQEFTALDLEGYFEFTRTKDGIEVKAVSKDMNKYILSVSLENTYGDKSDEINLEVRL